jgi:transcriptional regulator with XRE-family HTH domain
LTDAPGLETCSADKPAEIIADRRVVLAEKRRHQAAPKGRATLGQMSRAARKARALTRADVAVSACVAQAYLSYLEQDQREPSFLIAAGIARELEIPLDELASTVTGNTNLQRSSRPSPRTTRGLRITRARCPVSTGMAVRTHRRTRSSLSFSAIRHRAPSHGWTETGTQVE